MSEKNTTQVVFRIPSELRAFYEAEAQKEKRKLSDVLRRALTTQAQKKPVPNESVAA